jgi:hypothetical protein
MIHSLLSDFHFWGLRIEYWIPATLMACDISGALIGRTIDQ